MITEFRVTGRLLDHVRADLCRPHAFAAERVGFMYCRFGRIGARGLVILAFDYEPVDDANYIDDPAFGAVINSTAFRSALGRALREAVGVFHVHMHDHSGLPAPSRADLRETARFVPDFFHARPSLPHGALILSRDRLSARVWFKKQTSPVAVENARVVGAPLVAFGAVR
jgi:hypothetical protein